jgi:integrase
VGLTQWLLFKDFVAEMTLCRERRVPGAMCTCPGLIPAETKICRCTAILAFLAAMQEADLGYGTQSTYLGHVNSNRIRENQIWGRAELQLVRRLRRICDRLYAKFRNVRVQAITAELASEVIACLEHHQHHRAAVALYFMSLTGGRLDDIINLQYGFIQRFPFAAGGHEYWCTFRNGKNRSHAKDELKSIERTEANLVKAPRYLETFMMEIEMYGKVREMECPFGGITTNSVGYLLRKYETGVTTYSFRKHFAARVFAETDDKLQVSSRLGHANPKMATFYMSAAMKPVVDEYKGHIKRTGKIFNL